TNRGSDPAGIAMETSLDKSLDPGKAASKRGVERELRSKNQTESGCVCPLANGTPSRSGSPENSPGNRPVQPEYHYLAGTRHTVVGSESARRARRRRCRR